MNIPSSGASRPIQTAFHRPVPAPTLSEALDAWVEQPELPAEGDLPAETRQARMELRARVLDWQRQNEGVPAERTSQLRLTSLNLRQLPAAMGLLHNLRDLVLARTTLTELPMEIGQLPDLQMLEVDSSHLSRLPEFVDGWVNLRSLTVRSPRLAELPESIGELRNLERLDLTSTRIRRLPASTGQLPRLEVFGLPGSRDEEPEWLDRFRGLLPRNVDVRTSPRTRSSPDVELVQNLHVSVGGSEPPAAVIDQFPAPAVLPAHPGISSLLDELRGQREARRTAPQQVFSQIFQDVVAGRLDELRLENERARAEANMDAIRIQLAASVYSALSVVHPILASPIRHAEQGPPAGASAQPLPHPGRVSQPQGFPMSAADRRALSTDEAGNDIPNAGSFFDWLDRTMRTTADAGHGATRGVLRGQLDGLVKDLLDDVRLSGESNLRAECFAIAFDAMSSCGDGAVHALNDMHVAVQNAKALRDEVDEKSLVGLGIDKFVLSMIEGEVQAKIDALARASGRPGDEVETRLFFQTKLREPLAYAGIAVPLPTQSMLYEGGAGVSDPELQAAAARIASTYHDGRSMAAFLTSWPPIAKFVETTQKGEFAKLVDHYGDLTAALNPEQMTEANYVARANALKIEYEAAVADLRRSLVSEVVRKNLPPSAGAPGR